MEERLRRLYNEGKLTAQELENAITKGWITEEQFNSIINEGGVDL